MKRLLYALALAAPDAQIPAAAQEVEQVAIALRAAGLTVHTLVQQAATRAAFSRGVPAPGMDQRDLSEH